jgi:hypothetical protein
MFEAVLKSGLGTQLAVVAGIVVLSPIVVPILGSVLRPTLKAIIKTGIGLYQDSLEGVQNAYKEARAELDQAR